MVTLAVYEPFTRNHLIRGEHDLLTVSYKAMLVTSYVYGQGHEFRADVTGEASGSGYPAGGVPLTGVGLVDTSGTDWLVGVGADDAVFPNITVTGISGVITYIDTGNAATDQLVSYHAFSPTQDVTGEDFIVDWDATGFLNFWM